MNKPDSMDVAEIEESLFAASDAKLHAGMCKQLSTIVCRILEIFPVLEAGRPRSKSGLQALCSLHIAIDKAKNLLQHCSECSKLYLAITGDSVVTKFEKAKCTLQDSLKRVQEIVPQAVGCQVLEIAGKLEKTVFTLDELEKEIGDDIIALLQKEKKFSGNLNDGFELEIFHKVASKLNITSSRAALTERRALKKLIDKARAEEDKRKESIVAFLLHLMRKYSRLFRNDVDNDFDSQGSNPSSPTISSESNGRVFERQLSRLSSFNFKQNGALPPEEFRCPISLQLMYDPVIISSGQTYERVCIEKWFKDGHDTCPKTQQQLTHLGLTPNYCVKGLIASWCEQNGYQVPEAPPDSLDLNYWRLALSEESVNSCKENEVKGGGLEEEVDREEDVSCQENIDFDELLSIISDDKSWIKKRQAVERIRFLLKDDEEARVYMGENGYVEALVCFLKQAVNDEDEIAQEVGAMALFNLAVNNNRNKSMLLEGGITPLLETMISNQNTSEPATALYLNLSCLPEAKPIIATSSALPFLIHLLNPSTQNSPSSKHDALHTLFNLSTHPPNIPHLLHSSITPTLICLLERSTWTEKAIAVLINLASHPDGKKAIVSDSKLISSLAIVLDMGEAQEQELAAACLLLMCNGDEKCSQMVLQEGVIPALVNLSVNGTNRGREKAQKLLKLFREQRQRQQSPVREERLSSVERKEEDVEVNMGRKSRSLRLGKTISSLWKSNKNFSVNQC